MRKVQAAIELTLKCRIRPPRLTIIVWLAVTSFHERDRLMSSSRTTIRADRQLELASAIT
jgi:hypothetical protein